MTRRFSNGWNPVFLLAVLLLAGCGKKPPAPKPLTPELQVLEQAINAQLKGEVVKARELYEEALRLQPNLKGVDYQLGVLAYQERDYARARVHLERAAVGTQAMASASGLLGVIAAQEQRYDDAFAAFARAAELAPGDAQPFFNWGEALREAGRPAEAVEQFRKAVQRRPDDPLFTLKLNLARIQSGQTEAVAAEAAQQLQLDPPTGDWLMVGAALAIERGDVARAKQLLGQAREAMGRTLFIGMLQDEVFQRHREMPELKSLLQERIADESRR